MSEDKGLYTKYIIMKPDGTMVDDRCFVLNPSKDPTAVVALQAYAAATDNTLLSADIHRWIEKAYMSVEISHIASGLRLIAMGACLRGAMLEDLPFDRNRSCKDFLLDSAKLIQSLGFAFQKNALERSAAISDLKEADRFECEHCAHYDNTCCETNCYECLENTCPCQGCTDLSNWKWRGGQNCWNGAQAVDAVEVEIVHHGYWIDDRTDVVCSHCKTCFKDEIDFIQGSDGGRPKRCPECGAKMDLRCEHGN